MDTDTIYRERGGGRINIDFGYLHITWPFATISIYKEKVLLSIGWRKFEILMSDITSIKRILYIPYFAEGIQILHKNNSIPEHITFWSLGHSKKIKEILESQLIAAK